MSIPAVSVIIPTYNYGHVLPRALDSVLAQTFRDFEVLVVDDGSTDGTPEVVARYGDRVRSLRKENGGVSSARNLGIAESRGEFVAFLDADDAWTPDKLEKQVSFLRANPGFGMVYADMSHYVDERLVHSAYLRERGYRRMSSGMIYEDILQEGFIFMPTVLVRRECFDRVGLFDPELRTCQDLDMWLRIADHYEIAFLDEPVAQRFDHAANATKNRLNYLTNPVRVFTKAYESAADPRRRELIRSRLRDMHFDLGYHLFTLGDGPGCRAGMFRAQALGRKRLPCWKYILLSFFPQAAVARLRQLKGRMGGREAAC